MIDPIILLLLGIGLGGLVVLTSRYNDLKREICRLDLFAPRALGIELLSVEPSNAPCDPYTGKTVAFDTPVGVVHVDGRRFLVCNYGQIGLADIEKNTLSILEPPDAVKSKWFPTGLFYDKRSKKLYVANYKGNNGLVFTILDEKKLQLEHEFTGIEGPEGVSVSPDGKYVAFANFDGKDVVLFEGTRLKWRSPTLKFAHGVAIQADKSGTLFVFATVLVHTGLYKFSLDGKMVKQSRNSGYLGRNAYLYPTTIVPYQQGTLLVIDADSGQISILDTDLQELHSVGANGPGVNMFHRPYGICPVDGHTVLVADTFKSRLVEVDLALERVVSICNHGGPDFPEKNAARHTLVQNASPCRRLFVEDEMTVIEASFPLLQDAWGLTTADLPFRNLALSLNHDSGCRLEYIGMDWVFFGSGSRLYFAINMMVDERKALVIQAPHCSTLIVIEKGIGAAVTLLRDLWICGEELRSAYHTDSLRAAVVMGLSKIDLFRTKVREGISRTQAVRGLMPEWVDIATQVSKTVEWNHALITKCLQAGAPEERHAVRQKYTRSLSNKKRIPLGELLVIEALTANVAPVAK